MKIRKEAAMAIKRLAAHFFLLLSPAKFISWPTQTLLPSFLVFIYSPFFFKTTKFSPSISITIPFKISPPLYIIPYVSVVSCQNNYETQYIYSAPFKFFTGYFDFIHNFIYGKPVVSHQSVHYIIVANHRDCQILVFAPKTVMFW